MNELLIRVESGPQLASFLRGCRARPRVVDERSLVIDLDADGCPGLATLVAAARRVAGLLACGRGLACAWR